MGKVKFTAPRVDGFKCPEDRQQAFLWDATSTGLALRVTAAGARAYVFQGRYAGQSLRLTIGKPDAWTIPQAQEKATSLERQIDDGRDPREVKAEITAADVAKRRADGAEALTVADVWAVYLNDRRAHWGDLHHADHVRLSKAGGLPYARGTAGRNVTVAGPLHPLILLRLRDLDAATVEA